MCCSAVPPHCRGGATCTAVGARRERSCNPWQRLLHARAYCSTAAPRRSHGKSRCEVVYHQITWLRSLFIVGPILCGHAYKISTIFSSFCFVRFCFRAATLSCPEFHFRLAIKFRIVSVGASVQFQCKYCLWNEAVRRQRQPQKVVVNFIFKLGLTALPALSFQRCNFIGVLCCPDFVILETP